MDPKLELLRRVPLFSDLGKRELEEVGGLADEVDVEAGKVLCVQGDRAEEFFVIVDGQVRIERDGRLVATLGAGDILGEIALVDGGPRSATATTETPSRLLVVGHGEFNSLLDRFPAIQLTVLRTLAKRVRQLDPDRAF
jgi:CRP-like cAMP-binding protein